MSLFSSPLAGSLAVITAYALIRSCIYHFFPPATSQEEWFYRDMAMSLPRLAGFGALLFLNRKWNVARFDWRLSEFRRAMILGVVPIALWIFYFSGSSGNRFPPTMIVIGFITTIAVGLFEEYAFRGTLLTALQNRFSLLTAILSSSALFAVYHIQAQSVRSWGAIFLAGVIFANLRLRGLSLGWLAAIHIAIDSSYFLFKTNSPGLFGSYGLVLQIGLLLYAVRTFPVNYKPR